jgi:alpha-ketoglutarate-dependent taurine dioxygenase
VITTEALPDGLGVELHGLTREMTRDDAALAEFAAIFDAQHLVMCSVEGFDEGDQRRLASALGEITIRGSYDVDPEQPDTQYVSNTRGDGILGVGRINFHHDHLFYENPLTAIMLYAIEIPSSGSVTNFRSAADMCAALSPELRARAEAVECLHLYDYAKVNAGQYVPWADPATASPDAVLDYKPFIWRHPSSGVEVLWLSPPEGFRGVERDDGIELYGELDAFVQEHTDEIGHLDHSWRPGDLVVWNNLMVAHARQPFDRAEPRTLRRTPVIRT